MARGGACAAADCRTHSARAAISKAEPDFSFTTQPSTLARKRETGSTPKGRLAVKLISARHLSCPSPASQPYVVVTFDQNEFISREPIHEEGEEATGVAGRKGDGANSPTATQQQAPVPPDAAKLDPAPAEAAVAMGASPLAASGLGRALALDTRRDSVNMVISPPPPASLPLPPLDTAAPAVEPVELSAYNPTWKHEVTLCVLI